MRKQALIGLGVSALMVTAIASSAVAGVRDVDNQADVNHPDIHQNVTGGNNANPRGANDGGDNLHGIGDTPGQDGNDPNDDGTNGFANELEDVHGGIGDVNPNAD
jgi:hypothetical protein